MNFQKNICDIPEVEKFHTPSPGPETAENPLGQIIQEAGRAESEKGPIQLNHSLNWLKDGPSNRPLPPLKKFNKRTLSLVEQEIKDGLLDQRRLQSFFRKVSKVTGNEIFPAPDPLRKSPGMINNWIARGYTSLETLTGKKGYPWEQIASVSHPAVMEQLLQLQRLLEKPPFKDHPEKDFIMKQALILSKQTAPPTTPLSLVQDSIESLFTELGKLLYALDQTPELFLKQVEQYKGLGLTAWLKDNFNAEIKKIKEMIQQHYRQHKEASIQSPEVASKLLLIQKVSSLLVLGDGSINSGLIDKILRSFVPDEAFPLNYEIELSTHLPLLKSDPRIRNAFAAISPPTSSQAPINTIIRALTPDDTEIVGRREASRAALTAFLSHFRQGASGSCFATFLAINMLASRPYDCINDFKAIIKDSALTRHVDGVSMQFPFILAFHFPSLAATVDLAPPDEMGSSAAARSPGIAAAAKMMGIKDLEESLLNISKKGKKTLTVQELINILSNNNSELYQKGVTAFISQEANPLLLAWENAIAGMAESNMSGIAKSAVINSTLLTILDHLEKAVPRIPKPVIQLFYSFLNEQFTQSFRMQYDYSVRHDSMRYDQHSNTGGFVLYDRNNTANVQDWTRIDNPAKFRDAVIMHANNSAKKTIEEMGSKIHQCKSTLTQTLESYLSSDTFLNDVLREINPQNRHLANLLVFAEGLKYTPWIYKGGNNPSNILQIYFESNAPPGSTKFTPGTAVELLKKIIELGKSHAGELHTYAESNPYLYTPVRTPGLHSFSLMLGHPSLTNAWEKDSQMEDWIYESVIKPGEAVSNSLIDEEMKAIILKRCLQKCIPAAKASDFLNYYSKLPRENVSIKTFRYQIKESIIQICKTNRKTIAKHMLDIDREIYNNLPEDKKKFLENSAVHFADTNWYNGINDIHFCFVVNPGNGKLEIWKAADDGGNLRPADQIAWVSQNEWEIYEPFFLHKTSQNSRSKEMNHA